MAIANKTRISRLNQCLCSIYPHKIRRKRIWYSYIRSVVNDSKEIYRIIFELFSLFARPNDIQLMRLNPIFCSLSEQTKNKWHNRDDDAANFMTNSVKNIKMKSLCTIRCFFRLFVFFVALCSSLNGGKIINLIVFVCARAKRLQRKHNEPNKFKAFRRECFYVMRASIRLNYVQWSGVV